DITPRICINYHFTPFTNIRLLYGQAFRMVPPQEIIRLPFALGDAKSEKTNNFEAIFTTKIIDRIILTTNAFWLKGSEIYAWNPTEASFNKATGWSNAGGSLSLQYVAKKLEAWTNVTYYHALKRATDAYTFMTKVVDGKNVPLPNEFRPLESPTLLIKGGLSYNMSNSTVVATELFYNGEIQTLHPKRNNDELFYLHRVPASFYCNLIINQNLSAIGIKGFYLMFRAENIFDQLVWNVLPSEAENWNAARYEKPHQIPNWGRLFSVKLSANLSGN
ncbi:MAG: TonB-dependent receptor, partial [Flammeovirgaceae bacterium]|nr:TonB-dependent receptor [Flammeovirgaceae bacterium]MDW8288177.1 TonB-dependent receptor [Flammeovirgaceae bacterium]